jgi:hypothetical protein
MMLPKIKIGNLEITRLIVGSNPFTGKSHMSAEVDSDMRAHFNTYERAHDMLRRCEEVGINAVQSRGSLPVMDLIYKYRKNGGNMYWLAQTGKDLATFDKELDDMMAYEPSAICLHGELTDQLFVTDRLDMMGELLEKARSKGLPVGICSHFPEVLAYAEENGLKPDYYMASVYNLFQPDRSNDVNKEGERFEISDLPKMYSVIRSLSAPTIALKILGAGRRCESQEQVKAAFNEAFSEIKKGDGVLVGMFDKYIDQAALNVQYTIDAIKAAEGDL